MNLFKEFCFYFLIFVINSSFIAVNAADDYFYNQHPIRKVIIWCTVSKAEQNKCTSFANAVLRDHIKINYRLFTVRCHHAFNKEECMSLLDDGQVTMTTLDAGQVFTGGRFHSLVPIAKEVADTGSTVYYSVALVKKNSLRDITSLHDIRGKKACFAGVGTMAGWVIPLYTLMKSGAMEIVDCNNHVKTATEFFGPSCAVNALLDANNPIGDNSDKLCRECIGKIPGGRCTDADPYAGYEGAFKCLLEAGDIAFLKHTTIHDLLSPGSAYPGLRADQFQLLCKDGSRKSIEQFQTCNWGEVPTNAIVVSSATLLEDRVLYQKFLEKVADLYTNTSRPQQNNYNSAYDDVRPEYDQFGNRVARQVYPNYNQYNRGNPYENPFSENPNLLNPKQYGVNIDPYGPVVNEYDGRPEDLPENKFEDDDFKYNDTKYEYFTFYESIPRFGNQTNLLFQDTTRQFYPLQEVEQTHDRYLGHLNEVVLGIRSCPVNRMTLCVTSDAELDKCVKMKIALKAQLLKPEMSCYKGHSQIHCMQAINSRTADVAVFDAGDIYTAGLNFDLVPFVSEVYNLADPEYYVVAVAKEADPSTDLTYLRGKYTCHSGINTAAGWIYPMAYLISNGWVRPYGCNSVRAAAEYFTKSCIPGALSTEYNTGMPYDNMCDLCRGSSFQYCRRDASEVFYGHTGAFRCLVEGGGHVAFVKHTTAIENTGGKRREWWARDALVDDFELLCPDGTRAEINDYLTCNLGKVKANAIVTRGGYDYNETQINAFINLFMYAQTFYGSNIADEFRFSLFYSTPPHTDLIFQDAATQLKVIEPKYREYSAYLGRDFMRAKRIVDCYSGTPIINPSLGLISTLIVTYLLLNS
ncbi:transferrin [Holotrichia oblita]|uniref:Transferrin n=1 Tax=Holotrichia oblita TaxID=644536 RepID=A0ACB9T0V6_HOLOL|nr:transferrin [Holotrichia oblita]